MLDEVGCLYCKTSDHDPERQVDFQCKLHPASPRFANFRLRHYETIISATDQKFQPKLWTIPGCASQHRTARELAVRISTKIFPQTLPTTLDDAPKGWYPRLDLFPSPVHYGIPQPPGDRRNCHNGSNIESKELHDPALRKSEFELYLSAGRPR